MEAQRIRVACDGTGDFKTITEAFESLDATNQPVVIDVAAGIYYERPHLRRNHVTLQGSLEGETKITYDEYALRIHEDGFKVGTFRTATFFVDADYFTAKNITFENSAGQGRKVGQALALYADGQHLLFEDCKMLGYQDTIFTAPLPPAAIEKNGFRGEKENQPRRLSSQLYVNCYIAGNIDFIFGGATAYFDNCEIFTRRRDDDGVCFVTAASTPEGEAYGYVFNHCRFTSNCPKGTVYLGRPWRNFAKTVILNSEIDAHIAADGWQDWNKAEAHDTMLYAEYNNFGDGTSKKRVDYCHILNNTEALKYTRENVIKY